MEAKEFSLPSDVEEAVSEPEPEDLTDLPGGPEPDPYDALDPEEGAANPVSDGLLFWRIGSFARTIASSPGRCTDGSSTGDPSTRSSCILGPYPLDSPPYSHPQQREVGSVGRRGTGGYI
ncbi:hypothetical protein Acr_09g0008010 [Actinidia rufa]|uniref:Uncharacterized protein n=1 Tax=Actinidia rufa TaxID=165716 RepID=A0A7J0F6N8_9ERIC|nr:hypothetical protein Acr_09g0008010 [Actinidia rufa]